MMRNVGYKCPWFFATKLPENRKWWKQAKGFRILGGKFSFPALNPPMTMNRIIFHFTLKMLVICGCIACDDWCCSNIAAAEVGIDEVGDLLWMFKSAASASGWYGSIPPVPFWDGSLSRKDGIWLAVELVVSNDGKKDAIKIMLFYTSFVIS